MNQRPMFNLIDEPWIPCVLRDGQRREVGIQEALVEAGRYAEVRDASPLVTAALHRLLLAILHRALDGPRTIEAWTRVWMGARFPEERIGGYLNKWRARFDLFDHEHPFYQVGGFELSDARPVTNLAHEFAGGNNRTLFDHTHELAADSWPPSVCARWLVANQAFALGGGAGVTSPMFGEHPYLAHAPLVGGVLAVLKGEDLFRTLMLNLLRYDEGEPVPSPNGLVEDVPAWERDVPVSKPGPWTCRGWLDLLTWQSRCIRLVPERGRVRHMFYAQGYAVDQASRPEEPMWFHRLSKDNELFPIRLDADRALWRNSDSLFSFSTQTNHGRDRRPMAFAQTVQLREEHDILGGKDRWRCSLFGVGTDPQQPARLLFWAHEELPVPARLLEDEQAVSDLTGALQIGEETASALQRALARLAQALGYDGKRRHPRQPSDADKKAHSLQGVSHYWAALDLPFRRFLMALGSDRTDVPSVEWQQTVRRAAVAAFREAAENSFGRSVKELQARVTAEHELNRALKAIGLGVAVLGEAVHA